MYWKDTFGNIHPFELHPGCAANVKLMFRRKDFNTSQSCPGPFSGLTWPGGPQCTEAMCILTSEHFRAPHNPACTGPVFNPVRTPSRPGDCLALPGNTLSRDVKRQRHGAARSLATTFLLWFSAPGNPDITHTVWQPGNVCRRGQAPMARAGLQFRHTTCLFEV